MIEIKDAGKSFGGRQLWAGLTDVIEPREVVALVGPSGSGKSTLLHCIGMLQTLDAGSITIAGRSTRGMRSRQVRLLRRNHLGFLFQDYALIENASVKQNLDVVLGIRARLGRQGVGSAQAQALEAVGLAGRERAKVHTLSGGEQQRVALARLTLQSPTVILADEPTGALDVVNAAMVMETLRGLALSGAAVVVATHNASVVEACDRTIDVSDFQPRSPASSRNVENPSSGAEANRATEVQRV